MATITLTPVSSSAQVQPVSPGTPPSTATTVPPALAVMPAGSILKGFVLNRDASGNPVLRTDKGDFSVQSSVYLKIGSDVVVHVEAGGKNFRANIVSVDGHTLAEEANAPPPDESVEDVITRSPLARASQAGAGRGAAMDLMLPSEMNRPQFSGVVLTPNPALSSAAPGAAAPGAPALQPGAALALTLSEVHMPHALPASPALLPSAAAPAASSSAPALPAAEETAPQALPGASAPNQSAAPASSRPAEGAVLPGYAAYGKPLGFTSAAPMPTAPDATQAGASLTGNALSGNAASPLPAQPTLPQLQAFLRAPAGTELLIPAQAMGVEATGEPLVQTPLGLVRLNIPASALPQGANLAMIASFAAPQDAALAEAEPAFTTPLLPRAAATGSWGSLQTLMAALGAGAMIPGIPAPAAQAPRAQDAKRENDKEEEPLGKGLMFFFSALKGGDFRQFIGDTNYRQLIARGHGETLARAEEEFTQLSQHLRDSAAQAWQSFFFPVMDESQVRMNRFHFKRGGKRGEGKDGHAPDPTRFVVEVDLSALGEMQLDGFVRFEGAAESSNTRFDLIIRSHKPLDEDAQRDLIGIYHSTGELTGYTGTLQFQVARDFPVHPLDEMEGPHAPEIMA